MMRKIQLFFILILLAVATTAQKPETPDNKPEEGDVFLNINGSLFFINNEYFGEMVDGYTYPGFNFEPTLNYTIKPGIKLKAGLNLKTYYGSQKNLEIEPIISADMQLTPAITLIMGAIRGNSYHQLPDAMFHIERQFTHPVENGLQIILEHKQIWAEAWINWEQFIFPGDTVPEIFTAGLSSRLKLLQPDSQWQFDIPLQLLAYHSGGQINEYEEPMQSIVNLLFGLSIHRQFPGRLKNAGVFVHSLHYNDLQKANKHEIFSGNSIHSGVVLNTKSSQLNISYWNAHNYMAPHGNPIYHSVSVKDPELIIKNRSLLTGKLEISRSFTRSSLLSFYIEGFYDMPAAHFDYGYGLHFRFTPAFFITNIN